MSTVYIYILSVYSLFSNRVGLPLHNIHIPSPFTSICTPLLFNIYVRELGMKVVQCKQCFKYLMVNKDGVIEEKSQTLFPYADVVCLMASNKRHLQTIFDIISGCIR